MKLTGRCLLMPNSSASSSPNKSQPRWPRSQNSMKRRPRNLRKVEETECQEIHPQKTVRGAVDVPPIKRKYPRLKQTPSQDHLRSLRLDRHKAERASFESPQGEDPNKQALPTTVRHKKSSAIQKRIDVNLADLKNQQRQNVLD